MKLSYDCVAPFLRRLILVSCVALIFINLLNKDATAQSEQPVSASPASSGPTSPTTQLPIVAIVNGEPITLSQLNAASVGALQGTPDPRMATSIKTRILSLLIDQLIVTQSAEKSPIAKSPELAQAIERFRRETLFNLYLNKEIGTLPVVNSRNVDAYINDHPEFFADRKTYHYIQLLIEPGTTSSIPNIEEVIKSESLPGLIAWLKSNKIPNQRDLFWRGSEQIDPNVRSVLNNLKDGDIRVQLTPDAKAILVIQKQGTYSDPILAEDARSGIAQRIEQDYRNQAAKAVVDSLRAKSNIQYINIAYQPDEVGTDNLNSHGFPKIGILEVQIMWFSALILLLPAAIGLFYSKTKKIIKDQAKGAYSQILSVVIVLVGVIWLMLGASKFLNLIPSNFNIQSLFILNWLGIALGLILVIIAWKFPPAKFLNKNRWPALVLIFAIQQILLFM